MKNMQALLHTFTMIARDVLRQPIDSGRCTTSSRNGSARSSTTRTRRAIRPFREDVREDDEIVVPEVHPELTSRRVLTLSYVEGYKLADILAPGVDQELKDWVAVK